MSLLQPVGARVYFTFGAKGEASAEQNIYFRYFKRKCGFELLYGNGGQANCVSNVGEKGTPVF